MSALEAFKDGTQPVLNAEQHRQAPLTIVCSSWQDVQILLNEKIIAPALLGFVFFLHCCNGNPA